jgi:NADPH:quinone reductase-like Zn-dependent oxidoreductase
MKAIVYDHYGPPEVLQLQEIEIPTPTDEEVLIRIRAASVNPYDWHFMRGTPKFARLFMGLGKPKSPRLGADVAGIVEAVGRNVTKFKPGDAVFGTAKGAFAEYACGKESDLALKPAEVAFEQAASVPIAGLTALQGLRDNGQLKSSQTVLINGAAGGGGHICGADCPSFRRSGHRRLQHTEPGHGSVHRGRSSDRLHPRGLHDIRAHV